MPPVPPRRRRARPVADAPVDALLPRCEEIARGWLLALLEQAPLQAAPAILATDLAREAPRLCDAVIRALADEHDLRRLEPQGALRGLAARTGRLAGAGSPAAAAAAVDALCGVVWTAMLEELRRPDSDLIADLSLRLGQIGELVRESVLEGESASASAVPSSAASAASPGARPPLSAVPEPPLAPEPVPPPFEPEPEPGPPPPPDPGPPPLPPEPGPPLPPEPGPPPPPPAISVRPDGPIPSWPGLGDRSASVAPDEALWVQALGDEIRRSEPGALALLAAELEDAERIAASQAAPEATLGRFAAAVRGAVRRNDILVSESDARAWIIARDTGRTGAHSLAHRISDALRSSGPWQGAPLVASIGIAVLGQDGRTAAELIAAAEEARFAAAAAGVDVLGADEPSF